MEEHITPQPSSHQPQRQVSNSKHELERQYALFALLWSFGSILIIWDRIESALSNPVSMTLHLGIAIAAFAVLVRPSSTIPFVIVGLLHVVHGLVEMPMLSTTDLMWMFFGATICVSFLSGWIVHRSYSSSAVGLYRSFAPCLRIMFVLTLLAIGIARLNFAFFNLETSPAVYLLTQLRGGVQSPEWVSYLTISMLLVVDLILAVLLVIPSLRRFAVGFGSCYFALQALIGFAEARTMLPLLIVGLFLFVSSELVGRICNTIESWIPFPAIRLAGRTVPTITVAIIATALWIQNQNESSSINLTSHQVVAGFYVGLITLWIATLLSGLIDQHPRLTWVPLVIRNPIHYLLLAGMITFAISPYAGLGSRGRFTEFSGLSTAGGTNNHVLIPQVYLVDHEKDLVEIVESNDPYLSRIADQRLLITWFDLVSYLQSRPQSSLRIARGDKRLRVEEVLGPGEVATRNDWFACKVFAHEIVDRRTLETSRWAGYVAKP